MESPQRGTLILKPKSIPLTSGVMSASNPTPAETSSPKIYVRDGERDNGQTILPTLNTRYSQL